MPEQTVLVVDDSTVNLKLADILLRKEGFNVHTAPSAEDALRVLRTVKPDLLLVDIQLPGMDGLDLARHVKKDLRLQDMAILALTSSNADADRERATASGCIGYITKPIDTRTFIVQIRAFLNGQTPAALEGAAPATLPGGLNFTSIEIESLRRRFLEEGLLQSRQMVADSSGSWDAGKSKQLLHRWIGSAGALGYSEISGLSRSAVEQLNLDRPDLQQLRRVLSDLAEAFTHPPEAEIGPMPEFITRDLAGQRVGLVDFAPDEAERLCSILESFGARPLLFATVEWPLSEAVSICHVVLVHVSAAGVVERWLNAPLKEPGAPIVLVGAREAILALNPATQNRASEFLIDGWQPEEALMRLKYAISRAQLARARAMPSPPAAPIQATAAAPAPARGADLGERRVLIADDDDIVVAHVRYSLEAQGLKCVTARNGIEARRIAFNGGIDAAVIDVNMPGKNGFDLLAEIRSAGLPVRVLLLTAYGGERNVVKGFHLGADDYVVKPCSPAEIAVRLKRLLVNPAPAGGSHGPSQFKEPALAD